jgi:hypothetical protein
MIAERGATARRRYVAAVAAGKVWLLSGIASLLAEPIPAGVLTAAEWTPR